MISSSLNPLPLNYLKWTPITLYSITPGAPIPTIEDERVIANDKEEVRFLMTERGTGTHDRIVLVDYLVTAYTANTVSTLVSNTLDLNYYKKQLVDGQVFKYVQRK